MAKKQSINLLPSEGFDSTIQGRLLTWALSSFRIIVIVTELVVMVAFISRFFLDAQNSDLTEEMQVKQSLVSASQSFENEFKSTQNKLKLYKEVTASSSINTNVIDAIVTSLPSDVYLDGIVILGDSVSIAGVSPNTKSIQQLIVNLESKQSITDVNLGSVSRENVDSQLFKFTIGGQI